MTPPIRFFCDAMLGRLARSLRFCSYSCEYHSSIDDGEMLAHCGDRGLVLLTRDTEVMRRRQVARGEVDTLLVESDFVDRQLRQVLAHFGLETAADPLCSICNRPLEPLARDQACAVVPDYVCNTQEQFKLCPSCGRIYWKATHWRGIAAIREQGVAGGG